MPTQRNGHGLRLRPTMDDSLLQSSLTHSVCCGRMRRWHALPFPGRILVEPGDKVSVGQVWWRGRIRSGVVVVDLPRLLRVSPNEVRRHVAVGFGSTVDEGTVLAGLSGRIRTGKQWLAPSRGMLVDVSPRTGVGVFVRDVRDVALYCRIEGTVTEVDAGEGILVEGRGVSVASALGSGGRAYGLLRFVESGEIPGSGDEAQPSEILVSPDPLRSDWVRSALEVRAAGIVAPSADPELAASLALAPAIAGLAPPDDGRTTAPIPILLTEGLGFMRMPRALQALFRSSIGDAVVIVCTRRPGQSEVVLSEAAADRVRERSESRTSVRVIGGPHAGTEGLVVNVAQDIGRTASGVRVKFVEVRQAEGGVVVVPVTNIEVLAG